MAMDKTRLVLVTGATGYIGGRLVPRLLEAGYRVRCLVRDARRLQGRPWSEQVEVVEGDATRPETLPPAMAGVWAAYYFIHSLSDTANYRERDMAVARSFSQAAKAAGVERIIYLGGLGDPAADLSTHLRSRQETGAALAEAGVPVTEFRAAIVVGSGSLSFEMIRHLTERLPVMICPRWVFTRIQPIAIRRRAELPGRRPEDAGRRRGPGDRDRRRRRGQLRRHDAGLCQGPRPAALLIPVPVLTPHLSAHWVNWMTPVNAGIVYPLIEGLRNEVVVRDDAAKRIFPDIEPMGYDTALHKALASLEAGQVETSWADCMTSSCGDVRPVELTSDKGMQIERRQLLVAAPPEDVYAIFSGIGGDRGWFYADWLWRLRGIADRLVGGPGFRRGRRHPDEVRVGDALDFWRVEAVEPGRLLRLRAEMKLPGKAWLQFEALPRGAGQTLLTQTAYLAPKGLSGLAYWYGMYPFHGAIFGNMIRAIGERAEDRAGQRSSPGALEGFRRPGPDSR